MLVAKLTHARDPLGSEVKSLPKSQTFVLKKQYRWLYLFRGIITCYPQIRAEPERGGTTKSTIMLNSLYSIENTKTRRKIVFSSFPLLWECYQKLYTKLFKVKYPNEQWMSEHTLKNALQVAGRIVICEGNWSIVHYQNIFIKTSSDLFMVEHALSDEAAEGPYINII